MTQSPLLEFESSAFAVAPGEDEETNPGVYGTAVDMTIVGGTVVFERTAAVVENPR
jgi:hypothetical protein